MIQANGLHVSIGAVRVLHEVNLHVARGELVAVVGANGAGKTTLLRIVAGVHQPDAGSVRFAPPDATVGYLPQAVPSAAESILQYAARRTGVAEAQRAFEHACLAAPQVRECHNITGSVEYLLRVETRDLAAYKHWHTEILGTLPQVRSVTSYVVMGSPKDDRA